MQKGHKARNRETDYVKAIEEDPQDIVHIYGIPHCNQFIIPSKAAACDTTTMDFAVQAEMVAVETSIDVGNILWIFYDCLYVQSRIPA